VEELMELQKMRKFKVKEYSKSSDFTVYGNKKVHAKLSN
jgi:hypothetical protein